METKSDMTPSRQRELDAGTERRFEAELDAHARGDCPATLYTSMLGLLKSGRASPMSIFMALLQTPKAGAMWTGLRAAALDALRERPANALGVIALAGQFDGWGPARFDEDAVGPDHARVFVATARVDIAPGTERVGGAANALQAREAQRRAAVLLLAAIVDLPAPSFPEVGHVEQRRAPVPTSIVDKNAVSILFEHAQAHHLAHPQFAEEQEGPSHIPTFACECSYMGLTAMGSGGSKKEAKLDAAEAMIRKLRERHAASQPTAAAG